MVCAISAVTILLPALESNIIARGRDAADATISTAFGAPFLQSFRVWTGEVADQQASYPLGASYTQSMEMRAT
jgi:hypothetical protein